MTYEEEAKRLTDFCRDRNILVSIIRNASQCHVTIDVMGKAWDAGFRNMLGAPPDLWGKMMETIVDRIIKFVEGRYSPVAQYPKMELVS